MSTATVVRRGPSHIAEELSLLRSGAALTRCAQASLAIAALLLVAAGSGLFLDVYRNNAWATAGLRGPDLVSLVVALPLLLVTTRSALRGSLRGQVLWLGVLGYVAYTYTYAYAISWNRLFLVYAALLSLSGFTLVRALMLVDPVRIARRFRAAPVRAISTYLWVVGVGLGVMELAQVVPTVFTGHVPELVTRSGHPTGPVYLVDLGVVVPLLLLAGRWLREGRPWGYVASAVLLVKAAAEGLALLAGNLFLARGHLETDGPLVVLWAAIAVGAVWCLVGFLRAPEPQG